jgi:eukaryotic-like serine/threonine-protein kinase
MIDADGRVRVMDFGLVRSDAYAEPAGPTAVTLGPDNTDLAYALTSLGTIHEELGQPETARPFLRRAVDLRAAGDEDPAELAESRFALARVLWPDAGERAHAHELARQALAAFTAAGAAHADDRVAVEVWIDRHAAP